MTHLVTLPVVQSEDFDGLGAPTVSNLAETSMSSVIEALEEITERYANLLANSLKKSNAHLVEQSPVLIKARAALAGFPVVRLDAQPVTYLRGAAGLHPWQAWEIVGPEDGNGRPVYFQAQPDGDASKTTDGSST